MKIQIVIAQFAITEFNVPTKKPENSSVNISETKSETIKGVWCHHIAKIPAL